MTLSMVHLRPFREPDRDFLIRLATEPSFSEPFEWFGFKSPDAYRRRWEDDGFVTNNPHYLAVELAQAMIGLVMWQTKPLAHDIWEIGAFLGPGYRGRGHGTTAQNLLAEYLFATTTAHRLWAGTETANVAEQRSLEKCGFRREGVLRGVHFRDAQWRDSVIYGRLRDDHPQPSSPAAG